MTVAVSLGTENPLQVRAATKLPPCLNEAVRLLPNLRSFQFGIALDTLGLVALVQLRAFVLYRFSGGSVTLDELRSGRT